MMIGRVVILIAIAATLSGCGEEFDTYDMPENGVETPWHECMRTHQPTGRHVCKDLR